MRETKGAVKMFGFGKKKSAKKGCPVVPVFRFEMTLKDPTKSPRAAEYGVA